MALRTHEIHPTLVHFPLTLVPTALALDAIGAATNNESLMNAGKALMPIAAASAVITGIAGFISQGAVKAEGHAHELLVTHRNMNLTLVAATAGMAAFRTTQSRPGIGYLMAGLGGVLAMTYTAYLGGKMVYAHGVGVEPHGVDLAKSPEIRRGNVAHAARESAVQLQDQVVATAKEIAGGDLAPAVRVHANRIAKGNGATQH
jgi:uncharacterized membrane protein